MNCSLSLGGRSVWMLLCTGCWGEDESCRDEGERLGRRANAKIEGRRKKWRVRVGGEAL